jgi:hypothetical protein
MNAVGGGCGNPFPSSAYTSFVPSGDNAWPIREQRLRRREVESSCSSSREASRSFESSVTTATL